MSEMPISNRVTEMTGVDYPIVQAPMGWIARAQLASAVSNAGGLGIIETSSGEFDNVRAEVAKMRELTDKPFGLNMPIYRPNAFEALEIAIESGIKTVTTSAGNPAKMIHQIKSAGLKVLHKVSTVKMALKAQEAGVDAVIAEAGFRGAHYFALKCQSFKDDIKVRIAFLTIKFFRGWQKSHIPLSLYTLIIDFVTPGTFSIIELHPLSFLLRYDFSVTWFFSWGLSQAAQYRT